MKKILKFAAVLLILFGLYEGAQYAVRNKLIFINDLFVKVNDIHGVDLSEYQGEVDMEALKNQNIRFVIIKATEGSGHTDPNFAQNWQNAADSGIIAGAYHFFSFDSSGLTQAQQYIDTVGSLEGKMIPVVDIEYYADKKENPPSADSVRKEVQLFVDAIEKEYGVKPLIYASDQIYKQYLAGYFDDCQRWVPSIYYPAFVNHGNNWLIWQYSDQGQLEGIGGTHIDMNVLNRNADLSDLLLGE